MEMFVEHQTLTSTSSNNSPIIKRVIRLFYFYNNQAIYEGLCYLLNSGEDVCKEK